jgi:hypothetical protein
MDSNSIFWIVAVAGLVLAVVLIVWLTTRRGGAVDVAGEAGPVKLSAKTTGPAPEALGAEMKTGNIKEAQVLNEGGGRNAKLETGDITGSTVVNTADKAPRRRG